MPVPRQKREVRVAETRKRRTLDRAEIESARVEAKERMARSARMAQIDREVGALGPIDAAAWRAVCALGLDDTDVLEPGQTLDDVDPTVRALAETRLGIRNAISRLESEWLSLDEKPHSDSGLRETWLAVLLERGMSRREAARVVGGHGDHVRAAELPPGEREAARRTANLLLAHATEELARLRAMKPRAMPYGFAIPVSPRVTAEIKRLERIVEKLNEK